MTAADRNTTADALDRIAITHRADAAVAAADGSPDIEAFHVARADLLADAAHLLRTPDTPTDSEWADRAMDLFVDPADVQPTDLSTDSDTATRARYADLIEQLQSYSDRSCHAAATLITDLSAERDAAVRGAEDMTTACLAAVAERDAAVARADTLETASAEVIANWIATWHDEWAGEDWTPKWMGEQIAAALAALLEERGTDR